MEDKYAVRAVVGTEPKVNRIRKGLTLVKCTIYDETGTLNITYFNNPARRSRRAFCNSPAENQGRCGAGTPTYGIRGAVFALLRSAAAEGAPKSGFRHCFYLEWIGFVL